MKLPPLISRITVLFVISFLLTLVAQRASAIDLPSLRQTLMAKSVPTSVSQSHSSNVQLVQQAQTFYESRRYQEAASLLQKAVSGFAAQGDRLNQAMALSNLAATLAQISEWNQADQAINTSLSILNQIGKTPDQLRIFAQTKDIKAQLQLERGQPQDAFDTWKEAAKIYQQLDSKPSQKQNQINQSLALQIMGLYPRACKTLLDVLELGSTTCEVTDNSIAQLAKAPASLESVRAINALGHILRVLGQLETSQKLLLVGLEAAEKLGMPQEEAVSYLNLANTSRALSNQPGLDIEKQLEYERSALIAYRKTLDLTSRRDTQIQAQLNGLSLLIERQDWAEAQQLWENLEPDLNSFPASQAGLAGQVNLAQSLIKLASNNKNAVLFQKVDKILDRASQQANILGDQRILAYILASRGKLAELQGQLSAAESFTTQAISLAPAFNSPDIAYQLNWQLGRIKRAQGAQDEAIVQYTEAVKILSSLRGDLVTVNPDVQFSFRESVEPVYRELVSLLLQEPSPDQTKLKQARETIEALQLAELDNFFRDACANVKQAQIDQIDPQAAVLYPIILSDRLEVILSVPGKPLVHYTTRQPKAELDATFRKIRSSIRQTADRGERLPLVQLMYDWLVRPIEANLEASGIKTLVFVLDGALRNLPIAIMHDGNNYIIDKYNLALTPGLQLLEPKPITQLKLKAITGGLTEGRQDFPPLPAVASEIKEIGEMLPTTSLLNESFIREELQKRIKATSSPIVHLATHGQFSSNAADTFIVTWDDRVKVKEFDQLLRSRGDKNQIPIELLVLSACETASGDDRAALGLAGIAIRSGARSTLGTLWQVNDESTSLFMAEFYRELAQGKISKAEALRNAQRKLLANPQFQNPYFWAPFVLVGNWQ